MNNLKVNLLSKDSVHNQFFTPSESVDLDVKNTIEATYQNILDDVNSELVCTELLYDMTKILKSKLVNLTVLFREEKIFLFRLKNTGKEYVILRDDSDNIGCDHAFSNITLAKEFVRTRKMPLYHEDITNFMAYPVKSSTFDFTIIFARDSSEYNMKDLDRLHSFMSCLEYTIKRILKKTTTSAQSQKDNFLSCISHEIRTPLNGIVNMIKIFPDVDKLTQKQFEYFTNLTECSYQLLTILNNVLDYNKLSANEFTLEENSFNLKDCIHRLFNSIMPRVSGKNISTNLTISENMPQTVKGDQIRITQMLLNILDNAVKYTDKGAINMEVNSEVIESTDIYKKHKIIFTIKDTGIGLKEKDIERIFFPFRQSSNFRSGSGLGLSITRSMAKLMGGNIHAESEGCGNGSTFILSVVLVEELNINQLFRGIKNKKVIVVDDKIENRLFLSSILMEVGCITTVVGSAVEALQYFNHISYDFGLIDICMPEMSGIELAQKIKTRHPHTPLIALSSLDNDYKRSCFDGFLCKPVDRYQLLSKIIQIINSPKKKKTVQRKNCKVAIVEDDAKNVYVLKEFLIKQNFLEKNILIFGNGLECVNHFTKLNDLDIIFMDILIPVMDGCEASRIIRSYNKDVLIIAVTASMEKTIKDDVQPWVNCFLQKPLDYEEFSTVLNNII